MNINLVNRAFSEEKKNGFNKNPAHISINLGHILDIGF